jgi:hypothetical protein
MPAMERQVASTAASHASAPPGNFPFQTATSADGKIVVHYYYQYAGFGTDFIAEAQLALQQQVEPKLGFSLNQRVDIYYYNTRADFLAGAVPVNPEITGAFSVYAPFTIYMPVSDNPADTFAVLAHELTHITFHQHLDVGHLSQDYYLFPLWFEEGQAASDEPASSPGYGAYEDGLVQNIRYGGQFVDIFSQFTWVYPLDVNTDNLSYAESRAFVNYLYATFGATRYHQFVAAAEDGNLLFAAELTFGADPQTLQSRWEQSLGLPAKQHSGGSLPLVNTPIAFTVGTLPHQASTTQSYAMSGGQDMLGEALGQAGIALLIVLVGLAAGAWWTRRQRRYDRAPVWAPPAPQYPSYGAYPPSYPAYQPGPSGQPLPVSRPLTYAEILAPVPLQVPAKGPRDLGWIERIALALAVPLALAAGIAWTFVDPSGVWRHGALAAAAAALALAAAACVLGLRARTRETLPLAYFVAAGALVLAALLASLVDVHAAGMTQGRAYEYDGAYALAAREYAAAGAPVQDRVRVESEWAQEAVTFADFADATTHFRRAIVLGQGTSAATSDEVDLLQVTIAWNDRLRGALRYADAVQVVADQLAFTGCDTDCKTTLQSTGGADYLDWIGSLTAHKQPSQVLAELTALSKAYPGSDISKSAQRALSAQSQGLAGAWAAGQAGDAVAMDLVAELVAAQSSDPLQLALVSEASQPVTGSLAPSNLYKPNVHLYFMAFKNAADARTFAASIRNQQIVDSSLFKVAAVTDAKGNFSVWLPAGFTYLPLWEAPAQNNDDSYYYYTNTSFDVAPYTPLSLSYPITW